MNSLQKRFEEGLTEFKLDTLQEHPNTVYAMNPDLKLVYYNPAWDSFLAENQKARSIENAKLGETVLHAIQGPEREFYRKLFQKVMEGNETLKHKYECNSPEKLRIFAQDLYPLEQGGLLIVNSLRVEMDMEEAGREVHPFIEENYLSEEGFYEQCSNCRRTKQVSVATWDWVPSLVENMPKNVSHSICPICFDYYWDID